ncbi:MAG: LamG domain-containing protein, partial [Bacteroidia bacterium]
MKKLFTLLTLLTFYQLLTIAQVNLSNGLVARYPFNGNPGDSSGLGNHGVLGAGSSAPVLTADRLGNLNSAYYFDGTTDIINVAPHISLRPTNTVSIAAWIRSENKANSAWNFIVTYRYGNFSPYDSYKIATFPNITYNNRWSFGIGNQSTGNQVELLSKLQKQDNVWMHVAAVYDGSSMRFYTNGLLDTMINTSISGISYSTGSLAIGNSITNAIDAFKGAIDELRIYNRALNSNEVKVLAGLNPITVYYSKSTGSINQLSTWGTNADGTGTSPLSFDSSNTIYNVINGNTSLSGNFRVGGTNSVVVFGNGVGVFNFPIASADTLSSDSIFLHNSGTLT